MRGNVKANIAHCAHDVLCIRRCRNGRPVWYCMDCSVDWFRRSCPELEHTHTHTHTNNTHSVAYSKWESKGVHICIIARSITLYQCVYTFTVCSINDVWWIYLYYPRKYSIRDPFALHAPHPIIMEITIIHWWISQHICARHARKFDQNVFMKYHTSIYMCALHVAYMYIPHIIIIEKTYKRAPYPTHNALRQNGNYVYAIIRACWLTSHRKFHAVMHDFSR